MKHTAKEVHSARTTRITSPLGNKQGLQIAIPLGIQQRQHSAKTALKVAQEIGVVGDAGDWKSKRAKAEGTMKTKERKQRKRN